MVVLIFEILKWYILTSIENIICQDFNGGLNTYYNWNSIKKIYDNYDVWNSEVSKAYMGKYKKSNAFNFI